MTAELAPLHDLPRMAANYIEDHGWIQGADVSSDGRASLTGALLNCCPVPGYGSIAREVFHRCHRSEQWNDAPGRTAAEVVTYLRSIEIGDYTLDYTFGPQWREVVAMARVVGAIDPDLAVRLNAAARGRHSVESSRMAWSAGSADGWAMASQAAFAAITDVAWTVILSPDVAWGDGCGGARDAATALVVRHLIGVHGFTQAAYDELTGPWRAVLGRLHADDAAAVPA